MIIFGELCALACAASWAGASNLFSHSVKAYTPMALNLVKGVVSVIILFFLMLLFNDNLFPQAETSLYLYLFVSGIFGIGIGDTLYFQALEVLGPNVTILMETLAPPFTGLLAFAYYKNTISFIGWVGITLVVLGIYFVVRKNQPEEGQQLSAKDIETQATFVEIPLIPQAEQLLQQQTQIDQQNDLIAIIKSKKFKGIASGVMCMFFHSFGMILSHDALKTRQFDALTSSFLRLIAGSIFIAIVMFFKKSETFKIPKQSQKDNMILALGILLGPIFCIVFQQISLMYTRPEIAQTLMGTTPIFTIFISAWKGQKVSQKYIIGSLIALVGVALIVWSK
ncbi:hypothetical protein ABPG74_003653 [Tetrahymena malaccensis]